MLWPFVPLAALLLNTKGAAKTDQSKARRARARRARARRARARRARARRARRIRRRTKAKLRRRKGLPGKELSDPIRDLFGPPERPARVRRPKKKKRRLTFKKPRARMPPPAPRKRRRKAPPSKLTVKPIAKPAPVAQRPSLAERFVRDLRARVLDRNGVARYQRQLGGLDPDGRVGDRTKARVDSLMQQGVDWSGIRPPTTPRDPTPPDETTAARELVDYIRRYKGKRASRIHIYQRAMGMSSVGPVGPKTKARVKALIGVNL